MRRLADIALAEFADIVISATVGIAKLRWRHVATFPKHFHDGAEGQVVESDLPDEPEQALHVFLTFCRKKLAG